MSAAQSLEASNPNPSSTIEEEFGAAASVGVGSVLGRYELLMPIAAGGMAMVWAARLRGTRGFQKIVAVKTMLPKLSEDPHFEQMFLDEASLASGIRHPHVVETLDLGEHQGVLYLVMEWIEGVPLNQIMKEAKRADGVPYAVATRIAMQACAGLHAAHELTDAKGQLVGLVHRDVSPQNVLVTFDGVTKVVDFGVAKATALGGGATVAGQIKGKVAYMAPEQVRGEVLDRRVDVFAMGIVLYALTTGKHPFRRESEAATMYNIASPDPVVPPERVVEGYPKELSRIVQTALAKDPAKRYASASDMQRALDGLPTEFRAAADEDVGAFVKKVFGAHREQRRAALDRALEKSDNSRPRAPLGAGLEHTQGTVTPVSQVGLARPSLVTATGISSALSDAGTDGTAVASASATSPQASKLPLIAASLAVVLALSAVVYVIATRGPTAPPTEATQPSATEARAAEAKAAEAKAAEAKAAEAKAAEAKALEAKAAEAKAAEAKAAESAAPVAGTAPVRPSAGVTAKPGVSRPATGGSKPDGAKPEVAAKPPSGGSKPKDWGTDPGF